MGSSWTSSTVRSKHDGAASARARGGLARSLLLFLLPVVFLPLVTFAVVIYQQVQADLTRQVTAQLTSLASLKEDQINQWAAARVADINTLARAPDLVMAAQAYLADRNDPAAQAVEDRLRHFLRGMPIYEAVMLTEAGSGQVMITTMGAPSDRFVGQAFLDASQLSAARQGAYMLPPVFNPQLGDMQLLVVAPMSVPDQGVIAVLHALVRYEQLRDTVSPSPGLGTTGHSYVVTRDGYQLGSTLSGITAGPDSVGIERARMEHTNGSAIYLDRAGQEVFGVYHWMPDYELAILVEQGTSEALAPLRRFTAVLVAVSLAGLVVGALAVFFVTRRLLTGPLETLTEGAMRLAGGDLNTMVTVRSQNEIGVLADTFNGMATELRGLYQDLESKVEARTQQLEAAAEVGRAATSVLSMDELLSRTVDLIRDRFGYYHVGIFLLDDSGRWAVLQEATGPAGAQLKARGHRLAVGSNSLIGWVTANRQPRIALDVATDEVHFRNELLPDTRSEAALPLRVGDQLIGALDVQSRSLNAFSQSDIDVLQILADQVAIGLENGRQFARQERAAQLNRRVTHLTARLHRSLSLDAILESTATEVGEAFGARKVVVRLTPEVVPALAATDTARGSNGTSNGSGGAHEAPTES